jgi:uncharacterized protein
MELDLEQAFEEPIALSHAFEIPVQRLERPELLSLSPVRFGGRLSKSEIGFLLEGTLSFEGTVACARCLGEVPYSRAVRVTWTFAPAHERPAHEEIELQAKDLDVVWYDELRIPFEPFIEEQLHLELPWKPLCREECRGLCPGCGADRNSTECGCTERTDGRWAALEALRTLKN